MMVRDVKNRRPSSCGGFCRRAAGKPREGGKKRLVEVSYDPLKPFKICVLFKGNFYLVPEAHSLVLCIVPFVDDVRFFGFNFCSVASF
jgi:hypothetical protein